LRERPRIRRAPFRSTIADDIDSATDSFIKAASATGSWDRMSARTARATKVELTWFDKLDKQVGFLLRKASQRNLTIFQKQAPVPSLTSVQAAALIVLLDYSPCSLTTLGRAAAMDPATTRGVAERLSEKGWVSLVADAKDKRKVMVKLEKKGRQFAIDLVPVLYAIADETLEPLNEAERVALVYLLGKISDGPSDTSEAK
jgi:MarR family transcriptional regulator, lower aerobic nicotinate degradation pathway regulator